MSITGTYLVKSYPHWDFNQQGDSCRQLHSQMSQSHSLRSASLCLFWMPVCMFVSAYVKPAKSKKQTAANCTALPGMADCLLPCARDRDYLCYHEQLIPTCCSPLVLHPVLPRVWEVLLQIAVPIPLAAGGPESLCFLLFSLSFLALLLPSLQ